MQTLLYAPCAREQPDRQSTMYESFPLEATDYILHTTYMFPQQNCVVLNAPDMGIFQLIGGLFINNESQFLEP